MAKRRIEGSFVALITPMNADGTIDFGGFRTLLDFQERHGSAAVLIMGSTGEVSMLMPEERRAVIDRTIGMKSGRMEFWYGCTGPSTDQTIDYVRYAAAAGADGAIIAAPPYICAPEDDITAFFLEVADASPIPIGIYNNPPRVKTDLTHTAILRLAEHPNIVVNKESTARVGQIAQTVAGNPDMSLMCCDSPTLGLVVPLMSLGGHGTANMSGNLIPEEMAVISTPWKGWQDASAFRDAWITNLPMLHFTYSAINPVAVKSLMAAVGLPAGPLRKPLRPLKPEHLQQGLEICRALGLDRKYGYKLPTASAAAE
ncbi:MAG: 4-hydroxy-tetrahydrodipicolinate synthase [Alphaproteobacteria bacterium]|nr:4-hydroxy-tetrahydrodipicolinate synthase [Alphaproteobacteria bacterium]